MEDADGSPYPVSPDLRVGTEQDPEMSPCPASPDLIRSQEEDTERSPYPVSLDLTGGTPCPASPGTFADTPLAPVTPLHRSPVTTEQ